jgi:hypothetical protein
MADTASEIRDLAPDLVGVKSRVSWSAIFGGTFVAMACYVVLTFLLAAIGITLTESGVRANAVGWGVLVAVLCTIVISLFVGGWVSSQLTVGENQEEAAIYGILTWAAVTGITLALVGLGVRAGYFAVVGGAVLTQNNERIPPWEDTARQAGVPEKQINDAKAAIDPNRVRTEMNDPANQEKAREAAIASSWTALVGTMLSMAAAVGGALVGKGTSFRIFAVVRPGEHRRVVIPTA